MRPDCQLRAFNAEVTDSFTIAFSPCSHSCPPTLVPSFGNDGEGCCGWCIALSFHDTSSPRTWRSSVISLSSFGPSLVIIGRFSPRLGSLGLIFEMDRGTLILCPHKTFFFFGYKIGPLSPMISLFFLLIFFPLSRLKRFSLSFLFFFFFFSVSFLLNSNPTFSFSFLVFVFIFSNLVFFIFELLKKMWFLIYSLFFFLMIYLFIYVGVWIVFSSHLFVLLFSSSSFHFNACLFYVQNENHRACGLIE